MKRTYRICLLPGDGIGPEIMAQAEKLLATVGPAYEVEFMCTRHLIGGCAIDATRAAGGPATALPEETLDAARKADAVLLAAVGGPQWDDPVPGDPRPEQGLLAIRKALGLYLNLRPVHAYPMLAGASPLRRELLDGADLIIVRELTGGLYYGEHRRETRPAPAGVPARPQAASPDGVSIAGRHGFGGGPAAERFATDTMEYAEHEIERVVRRAFEIARGRRVGCVHSVDKANVLETSRLWREVAHRVAEDYPDVAFCDMLVDNCAMQLVADPAQFDVIVTENTFGDILSDEASMIAGSLGMLASASLGDRTALYEPCHGSAPDIAGRGVANPLAMLLSVALMLRHSLGMEEAAARIEAAIGAVLDQGWRTGDIADPDTPADRVLDTAAMGDRVVRAFLGSQAR